MTSDGKKCVALGICGGIAAYKSAELCRLFKKAGYEVQVLMTENSCRFIGVQTLQTLSQRPVITTLWISGSEWKPEHVALADEADIFVVAPATANFIGKMANGIADDALTTYALTHDKQTLIAPAMNPKMWKNPAVTDNVRRMRDRGIHFIGPCAGEVACGAEGEGRMMPVADIFAAADELLR